MPLQSLAQQVLDWLAANLWVLFLTGIFIGFLLGGFVLVARYSAIKRYVNLVQTTALEMLESRFMGVKIVCRRTFARPTSATINVLNLPPPPLRSTKILTPSEVVLAGSEEHFYYIPENIDPDLPKGIAFPKIAKLVYGKPPNPELTQSLSTDFITAQAGGLWIPGRVGPNNVGLSPKKFMTRAARKSSRNFYILDYLEQGDCVGFIQPVSKKSKLIPIFAEISGYILQFGALERTPVVEGAALFLLAKLEPQHILSPHVGTFFDATQDGQPYAELGKKVLAGQVLGVIKHLGKLTPIEHEITAPVDLILLRSFAHTLNPETGARAEFGGELFSYRTLRKSPAE